MADSYLNKSGLSYFWTKIKNALSLKTDKSDFDLVDRYYRSLVPVGTAITSNKNLNTLEFLSVGKYYCSTNATTATLTNCPTGGKAFMMEVFSPLSTTIDNETTGTRVYRTRIITTYEGKTWYQSCYSNDTAGNWTYGSWQYMPNFGDVNNQIYANTNSKYGRVQVSNYTADSGKWVKIASMSHHSRANDNVNYTFRLDFTSADTNQYRQSYTFGVGARMGNTALSTIRFDYLDSEKFYYTNPPEFGNLVKVTRKWVAGTSSADHYIYFEIWVHILYAWKTYWLHPTNMNYKGDFSLSNAFFRNSDEWTYFDVSGTSAQIGQETYLTDGYEEVPMVDARKGASYLDPISATRQTTADAPEINGRGGIRTFVATDSMTDKPDYGNILHLDWDNKGGWDSQLLVSHVDSTGPNIYARGMSNGTWGDWVRFIREDDMVSKVNRNAFYNTSTTDTVYKKVTISGFPSSEITPHGVGAFIFTRKQFYVLTGVAGSGANERFYEIGTNENNEEPQDGLGFSAHIKLVYQDGNPPTNILYVALPRYGYCDIHSSGTITIEDSDSAEWESITANITCHPILASLKKASGGDLGNITAGVDSQSYLEVKSLTTATDIDTLKTTGLYIVGVSGCSNVPSGAGWGTIYVDWTIGTKYQIYINDGDVWKIWKRKWNSSSSSWGSWIKQVETADIKNGVLTIQKNGENVQTFSANQSSNVTANIEVPTKVSDIENDLNFIEDDTTQVCDEGSDVELEGTTKAPLEIKKLEGNTFQQSYEGKNLLQITRIVAQTKNGITITSDGSSFVLDGTATASTDLYIHGASWGDTTEFVALPAGTYTLSVRKADMSLGGNFGAKMYNTSGSGQRIFDFNASSSGVATTTLDADSGFTNFYITINSGVTFNNERFYVQLEESSSVSDYEPYVGGKASPSPEYSQSISTVTGRNVVEIVGKNKINMPNRESEWSGARVLQNGTTLTMKPNSTGGMGMSYSSSVIDIAIPAGETITWSRTWLGGGTWSSGSFTFPLELTYSDGTTESISLGDTTKSNYLSVLSKTKTLEKDVVSVKLTNALCYSISGLTGDTTFGLQLELGSVATIYAPFSKQTYEINLGKNLFDVEAIPYVARRAYGSDGAELIWNDYIGTDEYQPVEPNTEYTLWNNKTSNITYLCEYDENKNFIQRLVEAKTFTTTANTKYIRWSLSLGVGAGTTPPTQTQLEKGSTASSYASYFDPIELCGLGDDGEGGYLYKDSIYRNLENGKWYVRKEVGKIVLDESKEYMSLRDGPNGIKRFRFSHSSIRNIPTSSLGVICDLWRGVAYGDDGISSSQPNTIAIWTSQNMFAITTDSTTYTVADFKTSLATNPATAFYALATPTDTEITNEELISQLRDLWNATGYDDKTEISLLSYGNNPRAILSVCQYPNHIPVASQYKVGSVTVGDGLLVNDGGRISLDMSYIGTSIMKLSNSEIDTIMGVQ